MSRKKLSKDQDVTLAEEVEKYPILWDCTLDVYRRADLKGDKWADVAEVVGGGCTGDDVCRRFKNMKETFQANHKKVRENANKCSGAGTDDMFRPSWFLYKYLTYLAKTCAQAASTSNVTNEPDLENETQSAGTSAQSTPPVNMYFDENLQQYVFIPGDTISISEDISTNVAESLKVPDRPSSAPPAPTKRPAQVDDHFYNEKGAGKKSTASLLQSAVKAIEKIVSEPLPKMPDIVAQTPSSEEPVDQFSKFISSRLKMLDSETRKVCENEILQVIMKY